MRAADDDFDVASHIQSSQQGFSDSLRNNLMGLVLSDDMVMKALEFELDFFFSKGVWTKVPMATARKTTGKLPITVQRVNASKINDIDSSFRSRLVTRQTKAHDHSGISYFAPAPPSEALRTVISLAMTSVGDYFPNSSPKS